MLNARISEALARAILIFNKGTSADVGVLADRSAPLGVNQLTTNVGYSEDKQAINQHPQVGLHQVYYTITDLQIRV